MHRKLLTVLGLLLSLGAHAQMGRLFDTNQQLSSSFTSQVFLDSDGFIWSATRNGLSKYDGYQFRNLKKENGNEAGMKSNYVNCMVQDDTGLFYFGMWGALQTYNGERFETVAVKDLNGNQIDCYVTCFIKRKNGEIWVGTSGFGVLKIDDSRHAHQVGGALKGIHTVQQLMEDSRGRLWIVVRDKGLYCYDGQKITTYLTDSPMCTYVRKVCEDNHGTIYVGTWKAGLLRLQGGHFEKVEHTGDKPISSLYYTRYGQIVMGYDGAGVGIYDPRTGTVTDNPYYCMETDLSKSKVISITEDHNGNLWLGLLQKGLCMIPGSTVGFQYMGYKRGVGNRIGSACVVSTMTDGQRRLWIGTDKDGIYLIGEDGHVIRHLKDEVPATVMAIAQDRQGRIWIGSYNEGGGWIDPDRLTYHKYSFPQAENLSIFDIEADSQGRLWLGTMGYGVLMINQETGKLTALQTKNNSPADRSVDAIANDYVQQLSLSPDGKRLYVATTMGVCCYDIGKASWTATFGKNCLNYGTPTRVAREYSGRLWIGSNDGLYYYDLSGKRLQRLTAEKGLGDNGIASIEQDKAGKLWISTDHGLYNYDPKTQLTQSYFIDNGLQSNEFSDGASWASPTGMMIFGGVGGVTWFNPLDIKQAKWDAEVHLTDFIVGGESINRNSFSGNYSICDTTVIASQRFELSYHDNSFAIQLSTLTYDNPDHITYLYSINGEAFVPMQHGTNEIIFSHLPPGNYQFRVKAEQNNIETPERTFTVVIRSPWYRSAWAYCFYLVLMAFIAWLIVTNMHRKEQNRLRLQEFIHAEEMNDAKLKFFMNISHEIRTPMTLIVTPLLSLIKHETDPQRKSVYETIRRNAERILNLINQMMDLRKIDKGQMQMHMRETDLIGFVSEIHSLFRNQAVAKRIDFKYDHDAQTLPVWIDRRNFDKVIMNILSNAFKYTPTGGKISIVVTHDDGHARIAVSDNGEKIPEDKIGKIFERFYQTPSSVNDRNVGTGIGLDLTRSLVELHHGTIEAHNLQQGCEFVVTIPLGNTHLKPEEMETEKETVDTTLMATEVEEEVAEMPVVEAGLAATGHKQIIVVAEDDDEIRNYLTAEFGRDYEVKACANGKEALMATLKYQPDLVISDVMMPEMDGNTLCTKIKSNPSVNHVPVILLTAKNRDEDKLEGLETGADAYVVKPFNMDILRQTAINFIRSHQLLRLKYERTDELEEQVDEIKIKSPDEKLLERVMNTINKHLDDSDLSVDMIAEEVGISRVHLHRKMKELTGQTPHDFIRNIRLKKAANLLATQGMNITEVMYACGFSNAASFSTLFKKLYGLSPRDYMKEQQRR